MMAARGIDPRYWWQVIRTSDPDLDRWRSALRATLSAGLATLALWVIFRQIQQPMRLGLVGVVVAMFGSMMVRDPEVRDQRITMALLPVAAAVSLSLGSLLAPWLPGQPGRADRGKSPGAAFWRR